MARRGRHGEACLGAARLGQARQARQGEVWQGGAWHGRHGEVRLGEVWPGEAYSLKEIIMTRFMILITALVTLSSPDLSKAG
jgi:hypothetical protein